MPVVGLACRFVGGCSRSDSIGIESVDRSCIAAYVELITVAAW
jgi:hypothetical protein